MSGWEIYVKTNFVDAGLGEKAAIVGFDQNQISIWAQYPKDFLNAATIKAEITEVLKGFNDPTTFQAGGVKIGATKYMFIKRDESKDPPIITVNGKKGATGVSIHKTKKCFYIAYCGEKNQGGAVSDASFKIASYLATSGY